MKKIIAIVAGGDSSEHEVSIRSAKGIASFIDTERYLPYIIRMKGKKWTVILDNGTENDVDRNDFSFNDSHGNKVTPDMAYITIHGTPGEDGMLQGYFDLIGMPYSTAGTFVESISFNKFALNVYLKAFGVNIAPSLIIRNSEISNINTEEIINKIGLPCFVKPNCGGSSFGVSKVNTKEELMPAINKALNESSQIMVEAFMKGTELSCGCYKTREKEVVLPCTEVVSQNEFFDYDAKYNGQVTEITPARLSEETAGEVKRLTSYIYNTLGCKGIARVDYIVTKETDENGNTKEKVNMLEVNTTPGMTPTSFIPQQVRAAGLDMKDVLSEVIEDILADK